MNESSLSALFGLVILCAMGVGWFFACRWVAEQPGKVHYLAYLMMVILWPAGIPGAYVGTQRRKERLATEPNLPDPQLVLPPAPPAP
jgi:hypothetical protein